MHLRDVLMLQSSQSSHESDVSAHPFFLFHKVAFEVHYVLVGRLLSTIDVDHSEVALFSGLDESKEGGEGTSLLRLCLAHIIRILTLKS